MCVPALPEPSADESPLDDPMIARAYLQTSLDCDGCERHFASPPADGEATEDAVLRWAAEIGRVAKRSGWIAHDGGSPLYCPQCAVEQGRDANI